jgi:hypothetical protein
MRCAGCGRGGLAKTNNQGTYLEGSLIDFYPRAVERSSSPEQVPSEVEREFREAELCASVGAWRAASALLHSALEKMLIENGYKTGSLKERIDQAASDKILTAARQKRAHDHIRLLGNDILHDQWREVRADEYVAAHHYTQRILEDFYDERDEVLAALKDAGRISP